MSLVKSDIVKVRIIKALVGKENNTFYSLTRKTGISFESLKSNCEFLEMAKIINIEKVGKYNLIKLTERGKEFLKDLKKKE
jgi:predicted transcriptional regulator